MEEKKTSTWSHGLLWFGAAVSLAEIMTGVLFAPLGLGKGFLAIILGQLLGCLLLFFTGLIGGQTRKSSMETAKMSFGEKGSRLFSMLNVIQLLGWSAVMIHSGASAAQSLFPSGSLAIWSIVIGAFILLWIVMGVTHWGKINVVAMSLLFLLTLVLSAVVFQPQPSSSTLGTLSFGLAVELSIAMPLSWLPLISDYTRSAKNPKSASAMSALTYFFTSSWMYAIGLGAAVFTGESNVMLILLQLGMGALALGIVLLSTVTTTFLDVYSAGVSAESVSPKIKGKTIAVLTGLFGTLLAMASPVNQLEVFLYFIGSVFAPMIAIQITDYYFLKNNYESKSYSLLGIFCWLIGFLTYRFALHTVTPLGTTLPVMLFTAVLYVWMTRFSRRYLHV